jgi:metallo-beta-lactamase class B
MRILQLIFIALGSVATATQTTSTLRPDPPIKCDSCNEWNAKREPFRVFGNTYFVGPAGLGAVLIASDRGLILLDGGLPQSAALIDGNIARSGFAPKTFA